MRRLVIVVICLLALFTLINAYTREAATASQEQQNARESDTAAAPERYSAIMAGFASTAGSTAEFMLGPPLG